MKIVRRILETAGILLAGALTGVILLSVAYLVPVNETNKSATYAIMEKEGWYPAIPTVSAALDDYFHSFLPGVLDDSTDAVMLRTALEPTEKNVVRAAMDMRKYDYYWHGYIVVLRPFLAIFDYGEIRVINHAGQFLLVALIALVLYQKKGTRYSLLFLTSYFFLMPIAMPFSLQYTWVFYITAGALLYLVSRKEEADLADMKLYRFFLLVGMLTSFFDLLTYPLYTWGIPVIWLLLLREGGQRQLYYVKQVVFTGLWWLLGYAGMWLSKGCLGSLILGRNIFESAFFEVGVRAGVEDHFGFYDRLRAIYTNWKHYEYKLFVLILAIYLIYFVVRTLQNGVRSNVKNKALALVGMSSIVWYFVLANHTSGHHIFTYRIFGISVLAVLAILLGAVGDQRLSGKRQRISLLCVWGIAGVIACGLSLFAREDIGVLNGDHEYREVEIREGEVSEMSFTPSFPTVKGLGICIKTDAHAGVCRLVISDGEQELYEEQIALEAYGESTYATIPVSWKLERGKAYTMHMYADDADESVYLLVTIDQDMPLSEYGEVWLNGSAQGGQILSGLTYSYRPLSYFTLLFLAITWTGVLFAVYAVLRKEKV